MRAETAELMREALMRSLANIDEVRRLSNPAPVLHLPSAKPVLRVIEGGKP